MRLSEFIAKLQNIQQVRGDADSVCMKVAGHTYEIDIIEAEETDPEFEEYAIWVGHGQYSNWKKLYFHNAGIEVLFPKEQGFTVG